MVEDVSTAPSRPRVPQADEYGATAHEEHDHDHVAGAIHGMLNRTCRPDVWYATGDFARWKSGRVGRRAPGFPRISRRAGAATSREV